MLNLPGAHLHFGHHHLADGAGAHQLGRFGEAVVPPGLEGEPEPHSGGPAFLDAAPGVRHGHRERLVAQHVLAGLGRRYHLPGVQGVRRGDVHRLHCRVGQHGRVAVQCLGRAVRLGELGGPAQVPADHTDQGAVRRGRDGRPDLRRGDLAGSDDAPSKLLRVHQHPFSGPAAQRYMIRRYHYGGPGRREQRYALKVTQSDRCGRSRVVGRMRRVSANHVGQPASASVRRRRSSRRGDSSRSSSSTSALSNRPASASALARS
jgi:hypothetical protein